MATYRMQIYGDRNYRSQQIEIDGVRSASAALDRARGMYPGCTVKAAILVDHYDIGQRQAHDQREADRKRKHQEETQRYKEQEERIKAQATRTPVTSSGVVQPNYDNSFTPHNFSLGDALGIWLLIGGLFVVVAAWYMLPIIGLFGGIGCGIRYGIKFTKGRQLAPRLALIFLATIITPTVFMTGSYKLHEAAGVEYLEPGETNQ